MTITDLLKSEEKVGICVSGGLDSRTITKKLSDLGMSVACFAADLAQPDVKDISEVSRKMAPCGVKTLSLIHI